jgi:hypothetical protein
MADLLLLPVDKPDMNKLEEAYEVAADLSRLCTGVSIKVPRFFQYDGASIPPPAWQLIGTPFQPRFMTAAVFHDWVYHTHQVDFDAANQLFQDLLVQDGVQKTKAVLMKLAVVTFGKAYWGNDPDDLAYLARLKQRIVQDGRNPADYGMN